MSNYDYEIRGLRFKFEKLEEENKELRELIKELEKRVSKLEINDYEINEYE